MFQDIFNWYLVFVGVLGFAFLVLNYCMAESPKMDENVGNSLDYLEKSNPFECGFDSFRQSSNPVPIPFILIALLFLPFDLEVSSMLPYIVSSYSIGIYGLVFFMIFLLILVIGFAFELNSKAIALFRFLPKDINKNKSIFL